MSLLEEKFKVAVLRFNGNLYYWNRNLRVHRRPYLALFPVRGDYFFSKQRGSLAEILSGYFVRPRRFFEITLD